MFPEHDFAIAVLVNANQGGSLIQHVICRALKQYLGLESTGPTLIEASEEELTVYAGRYTCPSEDTELGMLDGKLVGRVTDKHHFPDDWPPLPAKPPMSLAMCGKDRLLALDGHEVKGKFDIVRKPDGSIGWLRSGLRILRREG